MSSRIGLRFDSGKRGVYPLPNAPERLGGIRERVSNSKEGFGMVKTHKGWGESRLSLERYLQVGDLVDEEMHDYFLNVLPPAYWSSSILQVGEPVDHKERGAVYDTLKRTASGWMYCGNCYRGQTDNTLPR
jgi:hypothetical protein